MKTFVYYLATTLKKLVFFLRELHPQTVQKFMPRIISDVPHYHGYSVVSYKVRYMYVYFHSGLEIVDNV